MKGKPMVSILDFLEQTGEFEICMWNNDMLMNQPIDGWFKVDVLLAFYSNGFPLDKVIAYVKLVKPDCINELDSQKILWERTQVNEKLRAAGIPTAQSYTVIRGEGKPMSQTEIEHHYKASKNIGVTYLQKARQIKDKDI